MATRLKSLAPFVLAAGLVATPAAADPALWQVSDANSSIYLFGSFHLFTHDVEWRSQLFDHVLADADSIVFEMLLDADAMAQMVYLTLTDGMYHGDETIADKLTPQQLADLYDAAGLLAISYEEIRRMRPWLLATRLSESGYGDVMPGVETVLQAEIAPERQGALETAEQQFRYLSSLPEPEQVEMLLSAIEAVLTDELNIATETADMLDDWAEGDIAGLEATFTEMLTPADMAFFDILITQRNHRWIAPLEQFLADDTEAVVIVGAGHLVGEEGVPNLLAEKGYTVTRIDAGAPPESGAP